MYCKACEWCNEKVGPLNLWGNLGLLLVKLCGGILGHSQALMADAFHSTSDVVVSFLVLLGLRVTGAPPDKDHPWGHGHIEFVVSVIVGMFMVFGSITITTLSLISIVKAEFTQPTVLAVWAALISVITNELMFRHALCIGKQRDSLAMIASAWENKADMYSSSAALIGVFGALLGFRILDPLAAIVVGFMIGRTGIKTLIEAVKGMTDYSLDQEILGNIQRIVLKNEGVKGVGKIKGRKIGQKKWLDMEILFDREISVKEAKNISAQLRKSVKEKIGQVGGINIKTV